MRREWGWFELASHLHMTLDDVKAKTTNRQFLAWMRYLSDSLNTPNRSDHYLMQIAHEVRISQAKNPGSVKYEWFKIPFITATTEEQKRKKIRKRLKADERKKKVDSIKSKWFGLLGITLKKKD